jgi:gliding motility-associated-like protein
LSGSFRFNTFTNHDTFKTTRLHILALSIAVNVKFWISIVLLFNSIVPLIAQGDCITATSVCNAVYDENNSPSGPGNTLEVAPGSCQTGGEFNSAWYIFSPQADGMFGFILQPNDNANDYDWSLFDITANGCAGINSGLSPEISCNSYGEFAPTPNGPTGISSALGGFGSSNGPGNAFGPPFNADVPVTAGSVYALVVMNFSATLDGYELDFGNTVVSIFDNTAPVITNISSNWCTGEVTIQLNEEIDVSTLTAGDFDLNLPGYTVTSFMPATPNLSSEFTIQISSAPFPAGLQLELTTINGEILSDICDNEVAQPILLDLSGNFSWEATTTTGCNNLGASIEMELVGTALYPPYSMSVDGNAINGFVADQLATGTYTVSIEDNLGCSRDTSISVQSFSSLLTMPNDATICDLSETFTAQFNGGVILWNAPSGITIQNPAQGTTLITASAPGLYTIEATVTSQGCSSTENFQVQFNYPPQYSIEWNDATCFGDCDGEIIVTNSNPTPLTVISANQTVNGLPAKIINLCAGEYPVEVVFSPGCTANLSVQISEPLPVSASFSANTWVVPFADPTVTLTSLSQNADSIFWKLNTEDSLTWNDTIWTLTLPQEPGTFTIQLMAFDEQGCQSFFDADVIVRDEFRYYVPTSFTPNGDGINDFLATVFTYEPSYFEWQIFNRNGEIIFETNNPKDVWMGQHKEGNYFVPNGVYHYSLTIKGDDTDKKTLKGFVTLVR